MIKSILANRKCMYFKLELVIRFDPFDDARAIHVFFSSYVLQLNNVFSLFCFALNKNRSCKFIIETRVPIFSPSFAFLRMHQGFSTWSIIKSGMHCQCVNNKILDIPPFDPVSMIGISFLLSYYC